MNFDVEDVGEGLYQQFVHRLATFGGNEGAVVYLFHVLAVLQCGDDLRVGTGPADALGL